MDPYELSDSDRLAFERDGSCGPYRHPLLHADPKLAARVISAFAEIEGAMAWPYPDLDTMEAKLRSDALWFQSAHVVVPELAALAAHPAIVRKVEAFLGPNVICWGSALLSKKPGAIHGWHVDDEHIEWEGVACFVGLEGTSRDSAVNVITKSHRIDARPCDILQNGVFDGVEGGPLLSKDDVVLAAARERIPDASLLAHDLEDGDFFFFAGRAWHGSNNRSPNRRTSVTFFYSRPDARVRIPLSYSEVPKWYETPPPVILVAGVDDAHVNRIVPTPG